MKGAIFDVDGTLIDSMSTWDKATDGFYERRGLSLTQEDFEIFKHSTLDESFSYIREAYNLSESLEEIHAEFENIITDEYKFNIPIKPYADEYLKRLKAKGVKLAIATSTKPQFCIPAFSRLGILDLFDSITYSDEVKVNKSNPDIYLLAAKRIGEKPEDCMVFEDISIGIKSAKSAGFLTCAIYDDTNKSDTEYLKATADKYILSWSELLED